MFGFRPQTATGRNRHGADLDRMDPRNAATRRSVVRHRCYTDTGGPAPAAAAPHRSSPRKPAERGVNCHQPPPDAAAAVEPVPRPQRTGRATAQQRPHLVAGGRGPRISERRRPGHRTGPRPGRRAAPPVEDLSGDSGESSPSAAATAADSPMRPTNRRAATARPGRLWSRRTGWPGRRGAASPIWRRSAPAPTPVAGGDALGLNGFGAAGVQNGFGDGLGGATLGGPAAVAAVAGGAGGGGGGGGGVGGGAVRGGGGGGGRNGGATSRRARTRRSRTEQWRLRGVRQSTAHAAAIHRVARADRAQQRPGRAAVLTERAERREVLLRAEQHLRRSSAARCAFPKSAAGIAARSSSPGAATRSRNPFNQISTMPSAPGARGRFLPSADLRAHRSRFTIR